MKAAPRFRCDPQNRRQIAGMVQGIGASRSIADLIRAREALEHQCDDALLRQERRSRAIFAGLTLWRMSEAAAKTAPHAPDTGRMTGHPFCGFRGAVEPARKCIRTALPLTTRRFIENPDRPHGSEIDRPEAGITWLQCGMLTLETQILQYLPQGLDDVPARPKFVVSLMQDSRATETDYAAFLVQDCTEVMNGSIGHLRVAASITVQQPGW